ncbi:HTH-type transcriptional regulator LutR [Arthrobacter saudimassiliensis]|uniref:HTH-type transcriptional regulator LutR n=1 Tax=Arthrobacter saudimassiliensis TaxID=1461584 RepID=A0A078MP72_9MICC|nr:HTH-type transcriptional regulator LutR [Arthrobacter saudimassiliensis]
MELRGSATAAPAAVLSEGVIEALGRRIIEGALRPGDRLTLESLQEEYLVSRTVVRESIRTLETLNLVYSKRRVGVVVQPAQRWNVLDARIMRWRLAGQGRASQFRSLTELRSAVEPVAAACAARSAGLEERALLVELAERMRRTGPAGHGEDFLAADIAFHTLLLRSSGNELFASLDYVVREVLEGRTRLGLMPAAPAQAVHRHELIARAVSEGRPAEAQDHTARLLDEVRSAIGD